MIGGRAAIVTTVAATVLLGGGGLAGAPSVAQAAPASRALQEEILWAGAQAPSGGTRGYIAVPDEAFVTPAGTQISPIIFINRCRGGCSFTKSSQSDSISNRTIIGGVPDGTRMTLSEFGWDDATWNATLACIREVYQPFGVQIVTEDPGTTAHHEAVLAGRAQEMSLPPGILGIAPLDSSTCRPQNNVISFSFANDAGANALDMCWTVAQESAHAFGLDHEFECSDPMTYIPGCGQKFYRNVYAKCGTNAPANCICGGTTQNSYLRMLGTHGPGTVPVPAPTVDISVPASGATGLPHGFSVLATALDRRGLNHVELWINGWKWAELAGVWQKSSAYVLSVPAGVPEGVMDIDVRGCGDTGVCGADHVTVTQGAPCTSATSCLDGQKCEAGKCFWDPPTLAIGDACTYDQACVSATCADVGGGDRICSESCVSGPNDRCPDGFACQAPGLGQAGVCAPVVVDPGGCCSTGDRGGPAVLVNLGLGAVLGLVVVRRRRRRR